MYKSLIVLPALLLPALATAQGSDGEYEKLVEGFKTETAEHRKGDGMVLPLLPDVLPSHEKFVAAAKQREGMEAAMPYLGWLLQNSPRNPKAHGFAVKQITMLAKKKAQKMRSEKPDLTELAKKSREAVRHLKYKKVEDDVFAKTLLDVKALQAASDNRKIAETARRHAFKLENLQVGMVAPDIVAKDLDGVEFKLSDYRGKVVVIDFWGDW
ncbi:MAG: peroxiredoxin family protein [Planctomycetota bacterium]|jgi:hypothetical protein